MTDREEPVMTISNLVQCHTIHIRRERIAIFILLQSNKCAHTKVMYLVDYSIMYNKYVQVKYRIQDIPSIETCILEPLGSFQVPRTMLSY